MDKINPIDLVTYNRFDLMAKLLYASYREQNIKCDYAKKLYKEHLNLWNGFKEYNNPNKQSFESFQTVFDNILDDIKESGFNNTISKVPISSDISFLNGAHRVAACLMHNKDISTINGTDGVDGQWECGFSFFLNLGLSSEYLDSMATKYLTLKTDTKIVTLFPKANPQHEQTVISIIRKYGNIVYYKPINLNHTGLFNLTRQLYKDEPWAGGWANNFLGYRQKTQLCFQENVPTRIFLVEFDSDESAINCKKEIRELFQISNHSVHINDYHHETIRLGRTLFNDNSIHYLNNLKLNRSLKFESLLKEYRNLIEPGREEDYCITASGVLTAYGLREANDIDYLHLGDKLNASTHLISSHNEYGINRYHCHKDEILFDPNNYFWYDDVKFSSLDVVKKLKKKRNEPKDVIDISLIDSLQQS